MGTPVPTPPIDYGNDCGRCTTPTGSLWAPGENPLYIYVYFAGITKCPPSIKSPPNGQTFKLTQSDTYGCLWYHDGSEWTVELWMSFSYPYKSKLTLIERFGWVHFSCTDIECPPETYIFHNDQEECILQYGGFGGVAVLHWMGIVLGIVAGMSLPTFSSIMHELFVKDETQIVHKFCFPLYGMNVKMLMSP